MSETKKIKPNSGHGFLEHSLHHNNIIHIYDVYYTRYVYALLYITHYIITFLLLPFFFFFFYCSAQILHLFYCIRTYICVFYSFREFFFQTLWTDDKARLLRSHPLRILYQYRFMYLWSTVQSMLQIFNLLSPLQISIFPYSVYLILYRMILVKYNILKYTFRIIPTILACRTL